MGKEIVYCEICGDRILEQEFEKGRAITVLNKNYCFNCKEEAVKNITMEDVADEEPEIQQAPPRRSTPSRAMARKGTGVTRKRPAHTPPIHVPQKKPSNAPLLIGGGVGLVATIVLIVIIASGGNDPAPANPNNPTSNNNTNNNTGTTHKASTAEKDWNELQELIATVEKSRDYDKVLNKIRKIETSLRGSRWQVEAARLKTEYRKKKREKTEGQAAEQAFAAVKNDLASDSEYLRYNEILQKLGDALRKAPPGSMISAEIVKARNEYKAKYEGVASQKYNEIIQRVNVHIDSEEYKPAIKIIDHFFPKVYRNSRIWKTSLEPIYNRCVEKTKKS
ncbi:MAG: hypothetical protein QF645_03795 [Planctomycetota bacterium]|nr:hypothetical protein [Planctomycetota bacterium]